MQITDNKLVSLQKTGSVIKHTAALPIYFGLASPYIGHILFTTPYLSFALLVGMGAGITAQATAEVIQYVRNPNKTPLNTLRMLSLVVAAVLFDTALIACTAFFSTTIAMITPYLLLASAGCMAIRNLFGFVENMRLFFTTEGSTREKYAADAAEHAIKFIAAALVTALVVCLFFTPAGPIAVAMLALAAAVFSTLIICSKFSTKENKQNKAEILKTGLGLFKRKNLEGERKEEEAPNFNPNVR